MTTFLLLFIFLSANTDDPDSNDLYSLRFKQSLKSGIIQNDKVAETSGIVSSRLNKGLIWAINDSGNEAKIYLLNAKGEIINSWLINGSQNTDWEDLTIKTDQQTGRSFLIIGDIGDNMAIRNHINILVIEEPEFTNTLDTAINKFKKYKFKYEDGARDAETILFDPMTEELFVVSKREDNVRVYGTPKILNETDTMLLDYKCSLPFHNVTSGDISIDGKEILLKNYNAIFYWQRKTNETIIDAMLKDHELLNYTPEPQGESIAWSLDSKGFYTISEKSWAPEQVLYYFERN